jgi:hypothetical protein
MTKKKLTDEEQQQAAAYLKLQDDVKEMITDGARDEIIRFSTNDLQYVLGVKIARELRDNPSGGLAKAILKLVHPHRS